MSAKKVLVAGGTGFVGSQVVKLFERLGYQVTVISRTAPVNTAKTPSLLVDRDTERRTKTWTDIEVGLAGQSSSRHHRPSISGGRTAVRDRGCHQLQRPERVGSSLQVERELQAVGLHQQSQH